MMKDSLPSPNTIYLRRLNRFIDVVYAVIFFHIISTYLPIIEERRLAGQTLWAVKPSL